MINTNPVGKFKLDFSKADAKEAAIEEIRTSIKALVKPFHDAYPYDTYDWQSSRAMVRTAAVPVLSALIYVTGGDPEGDFLKTSSFIPEFEKNKQIYLNATLKKPGDFAAFSAAIKSALLEQLPAGLSEEYKKRFPTSLSGVVQSSYEYEQTKGEMLKWLNETQAYEIKVKKSMENKK
jgi:hypothetical protein